MIITGIFMFLLGTKLGQAATKTEVKYEGPNKVTMTEERDDNIVLPGLGSPPFAPSFFHQGSNFFFSPQFVMPGEVIPMGIERVITPYQQTNEILVTPEVKSEIIIKNESVVELVEEFIQPIPQVQVEIESIPIGIPVVPDMQYANVDIKNVFPGVPMLIEEPQPSRELFMSEFEVLVNEIPPPPELPPLIITEIPKPVVVQENKRVILIPSAPELASFYPKSVMVAENSLIPTDCVQNIIFERFLPNVAFENGKMVELISIPATKRAPVVSSVIY